MIKEINNNEIYDEIKEDLVLVDFYATWCGPCKMMHPVIDSVVLENESLKVLKIDVDKNEELAKEYGIMTIPTLILFKDGKIVQKKVGFTPKEIINSWINSNRG